MTRVACTLALLAAAVAAQAQSVPAEQLQRCRELTAAEARLACYDAIALTAPRAPAAAVPAGVAVAATPAAAPLAPVAPTQTFGLPAKAIESPVQAIESRFEGRFEGWEPNSQIKMANGQVWRISDGSSANYELQSPKLKVKRGLFGAYFLEIEGANASPRVVRVK
jgi:hypothetical protein